MKAKGEKKPRARSRTKAERPSAIARREMPTPKVTAPRPLGPPAIDALLARCFRQSSNSSMSLSTKDRRAQGMRKRTWILVVIAAILTLPLLGFILAFYSTHRRMEEFRTRIVSGMSVRELRSFVGAPAQILHRGESLQAAKRSYTVPQLDEHTAIYFYARDGMPYFNVYVFVDERESRVLRCDIENLWS